MCDPNHCRHDPQDLCSCKPMQDVDPFQLAIHLAENITDVDWELSYQSLSVIIPYRLCLIGKCRICGGRMCMEQKPFGIVTADDFLASVYRYLYQFHRNIGQKLSDREFRAKFVEMFHEKDRPYVMEWLRRPENQSVHTMYRRSRPLSMAYTIVLTSADADKGNFPSPEGMGTFMDHDVARDELKRLVEKEKEEMEIPFNTDLYREDHGDDFWEAYQDGYAAGWFTRYEIIASPLYTENRDEIRRLNYVQHELLPLYQHQR